MLPRRRFLAAAPALAGLSIGSRELFAQRPEAQLPASLPPSVAALPSLRSLARPITNDERLARIERARAIMVAEGFGAILLTGGTSLSYFTNIRWGLSERFFGMVIPAKADPFFVCPAFELDRAQEQMRLGPYGSTADVRIWQEDENPYALVAQGLRDHGVIGAQLGIEETVRHVFADGVAKAAPALRIVIATPVTAGCRMIKDAHEIELIRLAGRVTLNAYGAAYQNLRVGMTQGEFSGLVAAAHSRQGFSGGSGVQIDQFSALPHGSIIPQAVHDGSILLIDGGCSVEGYLSDISRTFVCGKPTDKMRQVFDLVHRMQAAALAAAKPGAALESIDEAARKVAVDAGYGPGFKYFTHRLGHGLGMDGHEWPYLVRNNMFGWTTRLTAKPGMVFTNEPGVYIPGEFGVRLEDDMVITENGAELLTPQSSSIDDPFPAKAL
jgi:Xaa-Pro aminopeptidase